jgi:hypothetical protein
LSSELLGVIIGGAIGLAASFIGHVFAWFQMKSTRTFALRQAVYVESVVAMANSIEFFSHVSQLEIDDHQLARMVEPTSGAMFKIHVVGTPVTIAALSEANYELTAATSDLMKRRAALRSAIDVGGGGTPTGEVERLQKELFLEAMRASLRYQRCLTEVNLSARRELGLPLDEADYRAANLRAEQRIAAIIERTVMELEELQPNRPLQPTSGAGAAGRLEGR